MVSAHSASSHMDGRSQGFLTDTTLHTEGTLLSGVAHKFESLQSQLAWDEQRARVEVQHAAKFANAGAQDAHRLTSFAEALSRRPHELRNDLSTWAAAAAALIALEPSSTANAPAM